MNNNFCTGCGTPLAQGMKICPNCGKVSSAKSVSGAKPAAKQASGQRQRASQPRPVQKPAKAVQRREQRAPQRAAVKPSAPQRRAGQNRVNSRPMPPQRPPHMNESHMHHDMHHEHGHGPESHDRRVRKQAGNRSGRFFRIATFVMLLAAIYICYFGLSVFRIKTSSYDFNSQMKMSKKNYGQAIEAYFDEGSWSANPLKLTCTYKGKSIHNEDYVITFKAGLKIKVESVTVEGKEYKGKAIETRIMGMFI